MRLVSMLVAVSVALSTVTLSAAGQGRGGSHAPKATTHTTKTKAATPKTTKTTPHATAHAPKTEKHTAKSGAQTGKAETKAARKGTGAVTTSIPVTDVTPSTPTTRAVKNPKLEARLQTLLPPDITVQDAMTGFKNWGQFVAAVHVSNNLAIPFADLKARMTGITPGPTPGTTVQVAPMSLGQAIQTLKGGTVPTEQQPLSTTRISSEVKKAEDAANTDLRRTRERS